MMHIRRAAVFRCLLFFICVTAMAADSTPEAKIPPDQLDALVAPIALYPDPLLAQTLAAATYPLEIVQLQQWLQKNSNLKDKALADAVARQPWDPSVQAMAALPDVVKRLADDVQWTTDLGNAFLAQQSDVMDAVQRMRKKAQANGALKSNEQQKVETKTVEQQQVIVVEQASPQVVYVPTYNPTVVYGPPIYPYPPIYYPPPPPPGYYAATAAISFGVGVAMGAMWSGGWGWNCGWGHSSYVNINVNNNFNRVNRVNNVNTRNTVNNVRGTNAWQHNPAHRGGAPYRDRATADRYGGIAHGESVANRQANARQQIGSQGDALGSSRSTPGGFDNRTGGSFENRAAGGSRPDTGVGSGGADRIGSQDLSRGSGAGSPGAFGGDARGYNGSHARASSSRGASSMGARGGGRAMGGGGRRR
jgi:hypothetical protein